MKETDWTLTCLGELAEVRDEKTMPSPDDARAYVGLEHIAQGRPKLLGVGRAGDVLSHKTVFKAGDILFGKLRPALRKVVRPAFAGVCSTDILAIYPKVPCDGPFLQQLLHSNLILAHALQSAEGTKMPRTSWADLRSYRFHCPPPKERARIGEILAAIDDAIEKTETVIEATERLRQALLQELLSRGIPGRHSEWKHAPGIGTIPACWEVVRLGDLLQDIEAGHSPLCEDRSAGPDEWGVLKVSSVSWGDFLEEENKVLPSGLKPDARLEVKPGDVLVSRANTPELVGRAVYVSRTRPRLLLCDKTLRLVPRLSRVQPPFLNLVLGTETARAQIENLATGSSRSMWNLSQIALKGILVLAPSLGEQQSVAEIWAESGRLAEADRRFLGSLVRMKSALMEHLLTGQMRITVREGE